MIPTTMLHRAGQSLWLDSVASTTTKDRSEQLLPHDGAASFVQTWRGLMALLQAKSRELVAVR